MPEIIAELLKSINAWLGTIITPYDAILKTISYLIGPAVAVFTLLYKRRTLRELSTKGEEAGRLGAEAEFRTKQAQKLERDLEVARHDILRREREVRELQSDIKRITEGSQELWKLRPASRSSKIEELKLWKGQEAGAKFITFANFKGGVGKTTLAANFAAYISQTLSKPVLVVDLDFQGSLSNMLLLANEQEEAASQVEQLFDPEADLATVDRVSIHLVPKLNQAWLVPANYTFAQLENRLLLNWVSQNGDVVDVRYRLANTLMRPEVRRRYAAVIIDLPPRLSLAAVNAFVASHFVVVPTILDRLSIEAVRSFLKNLKDMKSDLDLDLEVAGIAGMMTRAAERSKAENLAMALAQEAGRAWDADEDLVFKATIPRRVAIGNATGDNIAYLLNEGGTKPIADLFDPLFEEIRAKVWKGGCP